MPFPSDLPAEDVGPMDGLPRVATLADVRVAGVQPSPLQFSSFSVT